MFFYSAMWSATSDSGVTGCLQRLTAKRYCLHFQVRFFQALQLSAFSEGRVTLSGVTLADVGSAFSDVVAGAIALFVQQYRQRTA